MKTRYIIYGLSGWCLEIFWTGLDSLFKRNINMEGKTYIWMFFIYGLAVFLEPIHNKIRCLPVFIRGGVYTVLIFSIEYTTGWFLKNVIGSCPWNYGSTHKSINGFITLDFIPVWFTAGLLFEIYHDFLTNKVTILSKLKP